MKKIKRVSKKAVKKASFIKKEWPIFLIFGLFFLAFFAVYPSAEKLAYNLAIKAAAAKSELVKSSLQRESLEVLSQAKEIVAEGSVSSLIKNDDSSNLSVLLDSEARARGLTFLAAVDKNGVNLASIPVSSNRGDYVFQTTAWGRAAAKGEEKAMIGVGNIFPLMVVGAEPIMKNSVVQGAVFAGYLINNDYAAKIKKQFLLNGDQIIFYSKEDGVLGDSFSNQLTKNLLSAYFNVGSDWVQKGQFGDIVQIEGENYYVANYVFPDPENIAGGPGGALIFLPFSPAYWNIISSAGIFLLFLFIIFLVHLKTQRSEYRWYILLIIIALSLIIFGGTFYYSNLEEVKQVTVIKKIPFTIYNSIIKFEPDNDVIDESAEQNVAIKVTTGGEAINAVTVTVNYDPAKVVVADIITANSFCSHSLFIKKEIDNKNGVVTIACGLPNPGFTGEEGTVAELLVQPIQTGDFNLKFGQDTQVLANDGLGTDVLRQSTDASYRVANFLSLEKQSTSTPPAVPPFSSTQPNSNRWYNSRAVSFSWRPLAGDNYFYLLDKNPKSIPQGELSTTQNEVNLSVKEDGVYYFHVLAEKNGILGPVSNYRIMIDSTPPLAPLILASKTKVNVGEVVRFQFAGIDKLSGLQKGYYVKIDNSILFPSLPQLDIPFLEAGKHYLTLRVFDKAGNFTDSTLEIDVGIN
jgi:hypothetical protein